MKQGILLEKAPVLTTKRLTLHPFGDEDLEAAVGIFCNDEIRKTFVLPDFADRQDAVALFRALQGMSNAPDHFVYGIYCKDRLIGFINDVDIHDRMIEIGYVIHPDMQNQGFATEMLGASIQELFRIGYTEIRAGFFEENQASRRVMEKNGMKKISHTADFAYRGTIHHCIYYALHN